MSLGERITELRKACGLSQYQLAKEMEEKDLTVKALFETYSISVWSTAQDEAS